MDNFSYGLGLGIGQQLLSMGAEVSVDDFAQAIRDVLEGKETALSFAEAQQIVNNHFAEMEKKAHAAAIEQGRPPRTSYRQTYHVLEVMTGIMKSCETGIPYEMTSKFNREAPMDPTLPHGCL